MARALRGRLRRRLATARRHRSSPPGRLRRASDAGDGPARRCHGHGPVRPQPRLRLRSQGLREPARAHAIGGAAAQAGSHAAAVLTNAGHTPAANAGHTPEAARGHGDTVTVTVTVTQLT